MRALPLAAEHEAIGARFGDVDGWREPLDYGDTGREQLAVRRAVGVLDRSARGKIRVTGEDRLEFLDGLLTNDMKTLGDGRGLYAATLDHKGRVHGDMVVYDCGDHHLLATDPSVGQTVLAYFNKLLVSEDVTLTDVTDEFVEFGLFGPASGSAITSVFSSPPPQQPYEHRVAAFEGQRTRIARDPYFGGEGYDLWLENGPAALHLFRAFLAVGATPVGAEAAEALRIEAGRPKFGVDMGDETLALEARLEDAISMTKGCYVGQEVVSRATYVGHVNRLLVGLTVEADQPPAPGAAVLADGAAVGKVTSAARSSFFGKVLALGYVRRERATPGTTVAVRSEGDLPARVTDLPFYRP